MILTINLEQHANPELQETIFTAFTVANHRYLKEMKPMSANVERKLNSWIYTIKAWVVQKWMTTGSWCDGWNEGTKYTDMITNFRAKKSGGELQIAEGAVDVPSVTPLADTSTADMSTADHGI